MQFEQKLWVPHNFPGRPSWWPLLGSAEEIGELAHSFLKRAQGIRMSENHRAKMKDAVGDVVSFLVDFCEAEQFDFALAVRDAWNHAKQRDWKKYPEYGRPGGKIVAMSASPDDPVVQNGYEMGNFVVDESVGDKAANLDDQIEHDKRIGKPRG
jgi:NTP pyrophosphatase (non-canonical NTP hydrolase)